MDRKKAKGLNSNGLKIIACIIMLCDHIGVILMEDNAVMRAVGRLAFPVFAFLLAEGYKHTSDRKNYCVRLLFFALISEIPFDLAFYGKMFSFEGQNIFFTLAAGIIIMYAADIAFSRHFLALALIVASMTLTFFLKFDYGICGLAFIAIFYLHGPKTGDGKFIEKIKNNLGFTIFSGVLWFLFYGIKQVYAVFSIIPITLYNGRYGRKVFKYIFYLFYPIHLLILYLIKNII